MESNGHSQALTITKTQERGLARASENMSFKDLVLMGDQLVKTGFLPAHIKNGAQAAAIILTGRELGMGPMRALRSLAMVMGKVTEGADSQLSRFKADGGRAEFKQLDAERAELWLKHPNGDEHVEVFTIDDAKKAGLFSNSLYSKHPKAMLRSRCITAGLKSLGWEGGVGNYDPDEARAFSDEKPPRGAGITVADADDAEAEHAYLEGERAADDAAHKTKPRARTYTAEEETVRKEMIAELKKRGVTGPDAIEATVRRVFNGNLPENLEQQMEVVAKLRALPLPDVIDADESGDDETNGEATP